MLCIPSLIVWSRGGDYDRTTNEEAVRCLRISWTDHITNEEVWRRVGKQQEIAFTVKTRKLEYFGNLMTKAAYSPGKSGWPERSRKKKELVVAKPAAMVWPDICGAL